MRKHMMIIAAAVAVGMALPTAEASEARYVAPMWTMGAYDPDNPQDFTPVVSNKTTLVFKGMTLRELKSFLDGGYEVVAQTIGSYMATGRSLVPLYNAEAYPSSGEPVKIIGDFAAKDGNYAKAVVVELTNGDDGVHARWLAARFQNDTNPSSFKPFAIDQSSGEVTYSGSTPNYGGYSDRWGVNGDGSGYGAASLRCIKFVPTDSPALLYEGVTLSDVENCDFYAYLGGGYRCTGAAARDGSNVNVVFTSCGGDKSVTVVLSAGADGVNAQATAAMDGGVATNVVGSIGQSGIGIYGITAVQKTYTAKTSDALTPNNAKKLVWEGVSLNDVTNRYLGCYFKGSHIANKSEGMGCNRLIARDAEGNATSIIVEYQIKDPDPSHNYVKCARVELTNGESGDGVYAARLGTGYGDNRKIGHAFGAVTGTSNYEPYNLFAAPYVVLSSDEDWSARGASEMGGAVVDLNGHALTAGELVFGHSLSNMVMNTAATTGEMRFWNAGNSIISNSTVSVGNAYFDQQGVKLVKDGDGTYYAACKQFYTGGTEIAGGTFRPCIVGVHANDQSNALAFGDKSGAIIVSPGGTLDWNQYCFYFLYGRTGGLTLNGGALVNASGVDFSAANALNDNFALTADSFFGVTNSWGLVNLQYGELTGNLGGHILGIDISSEKFLWVANAKFTAGAVNVSGAGTLYIFSNGGLQAPNTDFCVASFLSVNKDSSVSNYTSTATAASNASLGSAALNVYGTFKPMTRYFRGVTMQNGSLLDFSEWPIETAGWPVASAYTGSGDKTIKFASGATVKVELGALRPPTGTKLISWDSSTKPDGTVKFVRSGNAMRRYSFTVGDDGLYYNPPGFIISIR